MKTRQIAVAFIENSSGKLLIQDRKSISKVGEKWGFFGGGIDFLESPIEAMKRELKEELNLDYTSSELNFLGMSHWCSCNYLDGSVGKVRNYSFRIFADLDIEALEVLEGDGAVWMSLDELKSLGLIGMDREAIMFYEDFLTTDKMSKKTITFIRHARSSWEDKSLTDTLRPLSKRGKLECKYMKDLTQFLDLEKVEIFYCSDANRAQQTAELLELDRHGSISLDSKIYGIFHKTSFDQKTALRYIEEKLTFHNHIAIIGHDDGFSESVGFLLGKKTFDMPTCSFVQIELHKKFDGKLKEGIAKMRYFIHNKEYINGLTGSEK